MTFTLVFHPTKKQKTIIGDSTRYQHHQNEANSPAVWERCLALDFYSIWIFLWDQIVLREYHATLVGVTRDGGCHMSWGSQQENSIQHTALEQQLVDGSKNDQWSPEHKPSAVGPWSDQWSAHDCMTALNRLWSPECVRILSSHKSLFTARPILHSI